MTCSVITMYSSRWMKMQSCSTLSNPNRENKSSVRTMCCIPLQLLLKDFNTDKTRKQRCKLHFFHLKSCNSSKYCLTAHKVKQLCRRGSSSNNEDRRWQDLSSILEYTWYWPSPSWLPLLNYPWPISFFPPSLNLAKLTSDRWPSLSEGFALKPAACKLKAFRQSPASPSQQILRQR